MRYSGLTIITLVLANDNNYIYGLALGDRNKIV